jgi:hypothetical protein
MGKINKIKLSFKKGERKTGLMAVGNPYSSSDIKINKKTIGRIMPPSWNSKDNGWKIQLMIIKKDIMEDKNPNCVWRNITFKNQPFCEKEEDARVWLRDNIEGIVKVWDIYIDMDGG